MHNIEISRSLVLRGEEAVKALKGLWVHAGKRRSYVEERTKQREYLSSQIAHFDKLLKDNSIDENTHSRYKKLLEMNSEQKREATREKHGFTNPMTLAS